MADRETRPATRLEDHDLWLARREHRLARWRTQIAAQREAIKQHQRAHRYHKVTIMNNADEFYARCSGAPSWRQGGPVSSGDGEPCNQEWRIVFRQEE